MFSSRSDVDQSPNALSRALESRRAEGRETIDLTVSNPTRAGIPYDERAILDAFQNREALVYAPDPFGMMKAREAVADDYRSRGIALDAERIVLTASTSEAYAFLFKILADPGDEILVPVPSYPLFDLLARFEGVNLVPYPLAYDGSWYIDPHALRAAITDRTRAILVVGPNNPTGSYLKENELEAMLDTRLPIISDEVFATYPLSNDRRSRVESVLSARCGLVFALGGLSKLSALPQMKAAWIGVGGDELRVREALSRLELLGDTFLSTGTPVQHALPSLLRSRTIAESAIRLRIEKNLHTLRERFQPPSPITVLNVEGGWYATLRLPETSTDEEWALTLLEKDGIYLHPGHFFGMSGGAYLVVSLLTPEGVLAEGAQKLAARVARELQS